MAERRASRPMCRCCRRSAQPVHTVVHVDVFLPGCPPSADTIFAVMQDLLAGRQPDVNALTRFGA